MVRLIKKGTVGEPLLKCRDVAKILNLSEVLIRAYVQRRKIPFIRIGRSVRFSSDDIQKWVRDNAVPPAAKPAAPGAEEE